MAEWDQALEQNDTRVLTELLHEIRDLRSDNTKLQRRLLRMESTLDSLSEHVKQAGLLPSADINYDSIDTFITEQIQSGLAQQEADRLEENEEAGDGMNWNYFISQRGGFDEVLYMTVQDFFSIEKQNPAQLLAFLLQRRDAEVEESLQHLKKEYENLERNLLQDHFTELWELHHNLLKKKIIRTWKEEIFLEAFDKFIRWIQQ
ncbi:hypothetical protein CSA56_03115 [candidate division KSB3 bacterium]|uniref:Uncharacterized protein n=1 Tax=candidate division KSB3 bacterium TaxID=2044937 RepID=A0A2G6KJ72_9BACT|nr:MAG: hypothetical protein CSA56_03115 [candidate division KSB3 bacterium]